MAETLASTARGRLSPLLDLPNGLIATLDLKGRFLDTGRGWQSLLGLRPGDLVGRNLSDFVLDQDKQAVLDAVARVLSEGDAGGGRLRFRHADGSHRLVEWSAVFDALEQTVGFLGLEVAQQFSDPLFNPAIVANAPAGIITLDESGIVQTWNAEAEYIFNRSGADAIGESFISLAGRRTLELGRLESRLIERESIYRQGLSIRRKDGAKIEIEISAVPMNGADGSITGTIAIVIDVTKRNRAERELKQLNALLERRVAERTAELVTANEELEAFCFSVSHDLRAPLRAIDGFSRAVLQDNQDKLSASSTNHLVRVRHATRRMSELIDALLSLTRLTRVQIKRGWVDISGIALQTAADLESREPARSANFDIQPGLKAYGDPRLIRILLENLLGNAFKFCTKEAEPVIRFGSEEGSFFVKDNGAGFDMAYANRLFQPFERLHTSTDFPGNGIGLATAHRIVSRHGGIITAEGHVGKGATFRFTIPQGPDSEIVTEDSSETY